ncbi:Uma2 family endonuclease [Streptomyces sp. NPDC048442]|uniref:Uma2 family endonuclease n=1 Tax=Streptomyces sp. NPDC048442 TaxID=3154823 RepID=UPI00343EFDE6
MGAAMAAEVAPTPKWERATPENWMYPPESGWTYAQVEELGLPFDWDLVDGTIVPRGMTNQWHDMVRDGIGFALRQGRVQPYMVNVERCVLLGERNAPKPDVIVYDHRGLDPITLGCVPIEKVVLAVEVVSDGSRTDDRFRKPGMYADAGVDYFWRVERGEGSLPVVYEFWLHHEAGVYAPSPETPVHHGKLTTSVPFPMEIDLDSLLQF